MRANCPADHWSMRSRRDRKIREQGRRRRRFRFRSILPSVSSSWGERFGEIRVVPERALFRKKVAFSRLLERQRTHVNGLLAETESAQPGDKHYHFPGLGNRPHSVSTNRYANRFEISCPRAVQADCYVGRTLARQAAYPFGAIARLLMLTGTPMADAVSANFMSAAVCPSLSPSTEIAVLKGSSVHHRLYLADDVC